MQIYVIYNNRNTHTRSNETICYRKNAEDELQRNALLLYPYVLQKKISNGRAAEILEISKLDLIDLYGKMGFCYFDQTMDELDKDLETFKSLGLSGVTV